MINVRCEIESVSDVLQYIETAIPEAHLRERRSRQLIWQIQLNVLPISTLFNRMETARAATNMVSHRNIAVLFPTKSCLFRKLFLEGGLFNHSNYIRRCIRTLCTSSKGNYRGKLGSRSVKTSLLIWTISNFDWHFEYICYSLRHWRFTYAFSDQ